MYWCADSINLWHVSATAGSGIKYGGATAKIRLQTKSSLLAEEQYKPI
jgi:hypothetical protein